MERLPSNSTEAPQEFEGPPRAESQIPAATRPPRVWTALLAFPIAFILLLGAQMLVIGGIILVIHGGRLPDLAVLLGSPNIILAMAAGQVVMLLAVIAAAILSPQPFTQRLGMRRPRCSWLLVVPMAVGTVFLGILMMMLLPLMFAEPPEALQVLGDLIFEARGLLALALIGTIGIMPGIAEELLYRGYIQQRLTARWGGFAAILIANTFFALHHVDPGHMVAVFVLGLWLGFITWRTESIWPAIICHSVNNTFAVALVLYAPDLVRVPEDQWGETAPLASLPFLVVTGVALLFSLVMLLRPRR